MTALISPESIKKELTIFFYDVQEKLKREVEENMAQNYKLIF